MANTAFLYRRSAMFDIAFFDSLLLLWSVFGAVFKCLVLHFFRILHEPSFSMASMKLALHFWHAWGCSSPLRLSSSPFLLSLPSSFLPRYPRSASLLLPFSLLLCFHFFTLIACKPVWSITRESHFGFEEVFQSVSVLFFQALMSTEVYWDHCICPWGWPFFGVQPSRS